MGSLGSSLLETLGVGRQQTAAPIAPLGNEEINPGMKMFGVTPDMLRGGVDEAGAVPGGNTDVAAVVSGFKPKKINFWQALGDQLLMHWGNKPLFQQRLNQENMQRAMEGFTQEPLEAIRRVAQINPNAAWQLYNQYSDNARADRIAGRQEDVAGEKYLTRVGGMLNAIRSAKDPVTAYRQQMPIIRRYAEARGVDLTGLGDDYDENAISSFIMGGVSPEDQLRMEALAQYRRDRLGLDERKFGETVRNNNIRDENADNAESGRNNRAAAAEAGKNARSGGSRAGKVFTAPNGSLVEYDKSGTRVKVRGGPDGAGIRYYIIDQNGKVIPDPDAPK